MRSVTALPENSMRTGDAAATRAAFDRGGVHRDAERAGAVVGPSRRLREGRSGRRERQAERDPPERRGAELVAQAKTAYGEVGMAPS